MASAAATARMPGWPVAMSGDLASAYLDLSPRAFRALVSSGEIIGRKIGPKSVRYLRQELDAYVLKLPQGKGKGPQFS